MTEALKETPHAKKDMFALLVGGASAGTFIAASAIPGIVLPILGVGLALTALVIKVAGNTSNIEPTSGKNQQPQILPIQTDAAPLPEQTEKAKKERGANARDNTAVA